MTIDLRLSRRAFLGSLAASALAPAARAYDITPFVPHWEERIPAIMRDLEAADPRSVVLVGDSISEFCPYKDVAGRSLVNCGVAAIRQRHLADYAERFLRQSWADVVILFGGKNTARPDVPQEERDGFRADTLRIVQAARASGAKLVFCTVTPTEPDMLNSSYYPLDLTARVNSTIREIAKSLKSPVLDINGLLKDAGGWAKKGTTKDGIHLTPETYARLKPSFDKAVSQLLD